MQINNIINNFIKLLNGYWSSLETLIESDKTGSIKDDWLQANWEILVEGPLCDNKRIQLQVYGSGADANEASSRILYPELEPSHKVTCLPREGKPLMDILNDRLVVFPDGGYEIEKFVCLGHDGWFYERPPFDCVLVEIDGLESVFNVDDLEFSLVGADL